MSETLGYVFAVKSDQMGMFQYGRVDTEEPGTGSYATVEEAENVFYAESKGHVPALPDQAQYIIELRVVKKLEFKPLEE